MKILSICACISLDMNSVIPAIHSGLQHATTTCFTTFFPEPEHSWQTIPRRNTDLFCKKRTGVYDFSRQINTYIADEQLPWKYMWIEFDGLRVKEALSVTDLCKDAPVYHSHSKELREKLADEMLYIVNHPQESSFHLIGHLYLFLDYLLQSAKSTKLVSSGRMSDYYIKEAINYIEQNFQNNISIEDIAAVCGINRSYFGKIFRNSIGRSPQEFLMNYRMVKATELLKLTSLSIADVGSAVGYENQLHFSRAFKNIYGVSPREWKTRTSNNR